MKTDVDRVQLVFGIIAHYVMAFVGGFVGIFSVTFMLGSFASAQTGNLISMIVGGLEGDVRLFVLRLISLLVFFAAIVFSVFLGERCTKIKLVCVLCDMLMVVVLEVLPSDTEPLICLYPVSFAMALQWQSFRGIEGFYSATPFSTNNLRQFISAVAYCFKKGKSRRKSSALKALFYLCTVLFFSGGIIAGHLACNEFDFGALWLCMIPLAAALPFVAVLKDKKSES